MPGEFSSASSGHFPARWHNVRPERIWHRCKRQTMQAICVTLPSSESKAKVKRSGIHYGRKKKVSVVEHSPQNTNWTMETVIGFFKARK